MKIVKIKGYKKEMDNIPFIAIEYKTDERILLGAFKNWMEANKFVNDNYKGKKVMINQNPNHWVFKRRFWYYKIEGC